MVGTKSCVHIGCREQERNQLEEHSWKRARPSGALYGAEMLPAQLHRLRARMVSRPFGVGAETGLCGSWTSCFTPQLFALVEGRAAGLKAGLAGRRIRLSFVQRLPWGRSHVTSSTCPCLPLAIEQLRPLCYPLVISSSHLVAKGILTARTSFAFHYVHTPVRYALGTRMHAYLAGSAGRPAAACPWCAGNCTSLRQWM